MVEPGMAKLAALMAAAAVGFAIGLRKLAGQLAAGLVETSDG